MSFPPPAIPSAAVPVKMEPKKKSVLRLPMARRDLASKGKKLQFLTNYFRVNVGNTDDDYFYQYSVSLSYDDGHPVEGNVRRMVVDKLQNAYNSELTKKHFAYDGEKTLFTLGSLPSKNLEFMVVILEDTVVSTSSHDGNRKSKRKRSIVPRRAKTLKVQVSFASKIPLQAIVNAHHGQDSDQEAIRVLDIILRQHAAKQGCLLVRQSVFLNNPKNFDDVGTGALSCRGFHSSFRTTQSGLSLNIDVSTTTLVTPGPVLDYLKSNLRLKNPFSFDWSKAKSTLKNLRIKTSTSNQIYKITGLSDHTCKTQMFTLKKKSGVNGDSDTQEVSVYDYFVKHRNIPLRYSEDLRCINVGKPTRPTYFPLELCSLVSLQRYTKALNKIQRYSLVEKSRQTPQEKMGVLMDALSDCKYDSEPMLRNCGISINPRFAEVEGRVLQAPGLEFSGGECFDPTDGKWNFIDKEFIRPSKIGSWYVVDFSGRRDLDNLVEDFIKCGRKRGITINNPWDKFQESFANKSLLPQDRVEKMCNNMYSKLSEAPKFFLCIFPVKNSDLYGPWKRIVLVKWGIVTQCIAPPSRINDRYLTNVWLKINAKLGGLNSMLRDEVRGSIPVVSRVPTIIIGMDVSRGSPGQTHIPSIAAVVGSREWPGISKYRACVRTQSPNLEMIDNLFKKVSEVNSDGTIGERDEGMIQELLKDFYTSSGNRKPENVIIFRSGVSDSQFNEVLNIELNQIIEAAKFIDPEWNPKFLVVVAQKNHHTRFFQPGSRDNVPPGTVVDNAICHPQNYDFYMCAHAVKMGTSRPTHYHVLLDEIGFSANDLQELVHSLSYVYQRSTSAISVVAPIYYAHSAATQMAMIMKFEERMGTGGADRVPQLPPLKENISESMFFC